MNIVDRSYLKTYKEIKDRGISDAGQDVRPRWKDGSKAHTKGIFGSVHRYDLSNGFPILSLRKIAWKTALDEMLWIWQKKSNRVADLNSKIWEVWATEKDSEGYSTIGKAYGYQLGKKYDFPEGNMDQVDRVLYLLKNNPSSRRIVTNIFNHEELHEMGLQPCAYGTNFSIKDGKLNMVLMQRSGDYLTAAGPGSFNVVQYSILMHMFAHVSGLEVGELVHMVTDLHVYDRHFDLIDKMIEINQEERQESELNSVTKELPKLKIKRNVESFYDFKVEDFELTGYESNYSLGRIEVAE